MIHKITRRRIGCVFLSVFILSEIVCAQSNYEEVVYLKNESIIHGMIIEEVPNESIRIKTKNNDVILFRLDEVLKITKEEITDVNPGRVQLTDSSIKTIVRTI